jgi:hypothetical protein
LDLFCLLSYSFIENAVAHISQDMLGVTSEDQVSYDIILLL